MYSVHNCDIHMTLIFNFNLPKAVQHLLLCQSSIYPDGEHIDLAIQAVGDSKSEELVQQLTDYLMGDADDTPKVCIVSESMWLTGPFVNYRYPWVTPWIKSTITGLLLGSLLITLVCGSLVPQFLSKEVTCCVHSSFRDPQTLTESLQLPLCYSHRYSKFVLVCHALLSLT